MSIQSIVAPANDPIGHISTSTLLILLDCIVIAGPSGPTIVAPHSDKFLVAPRYLMFRLDIPAMSLMGTP